MQICQVFVLTRAASLSTVCFFSSLVYPFEYLWVAVTAVELSGMLSAARGMHDEKAAAWCSS